MMFNWIARNSKETESEQVTTILSVAYVIYAIQLNSQYHHSIEYKFSEPNFFLMLYVFVHKKVINAFRDNTMEWGSDGD